MCNVMLVWGLLRLAPISTEVHIYMCRYIFIHFKLICYTNTIAAKSSQSVVIVKVSKKCVHFLPQFWSLFWWLAPLVLPWRTLDGSFICKWVTDATCLCLFVRSYVFHWCQMRIDSLWRGEMVYFLTNGASDGEVCWVLKFVRHACKHIGTCLD